jgi:hypothetical protein
MSRTGQQTRRRIETPDADDATVEIDRSEFADRARYTCPRGHMDWDKTNNHIWCRGCRRQADAGEDVDPEYYVVYDKKTDSEIPWDKVRLVK